MARFARLSRAERGLVLRATALLAVASCVVRWPGPGWGLRQLTRISGVQRAPTTIAPARVAWIVEAVAARLPWSTTCLVRAAVSARLIASVGGACELVIGTEPGAPAFAAHAWVVASGEVAGPVPEAHLVPVARWALPDSRPA
ncbi:MAG: lasso peptide biosynthesis B2 protein [Vicinamibacterales bacterium]|nr:lasso peptide biosynthesis B2 protein [Vicinamibacterales bacterium]